MSETLTIIRGGDVAQLVEHRTGTPPTQVRFPGAAEDFSPRVNFQCRLFYFVRTPPCAIACIYICAHVKDPGVHIRVRWIMETLKHPACSLGWVARLCRSWLLPGKATRIFHWKIPLGQNSCKKKKLSTSASTSILGDRFLERSTLVVVHNYSLCHPTGEIIIHLHHPSTLPFPRLF